jgi:antitoxin YefM
MNRTEYPEKSVDTVSYSRTRQHLAEIMDKVNDDRAPVLITRQNGTAVVMMSLADYNALEETAYLLRSPRNARRLMASIEQLLGNGGTVQELVPDAD